MNAGIAGPLLTTPGADFDDDRALAQAAGYHVSPQVRRAMATPAMPGERG